MSKLQILDSNKINLKVSRIARQILEDCFLEKEIIIAGIKTSGFEFARRLSLEVKKVSPETTVILGYLKINKPEPNSIEVQSDIDTQSCKGKTVIVVDDVLNTGRTLIYGVKYFLESGAKAIKTAVLVDRSHNNFPIKADYSGFPLATTLKENIRVVLTENESVAYLE